jgi:hypothetical protein
MTLRRFLLCALALIVTAGGCSDDDDHDNPLQPGMGTARVRMTATPSSFTSVELQVTEVALLSSTGTDTINGWTVIGNVPTTFELTTLGNGTFALLGSATVPSGDYSRVRVKVGTASSVTAGGSTVPLAVSADAQNGIVFVGDFSVPDRGTAELAINVDTEGAIQSDGAGGFLLEPDMRLVNVATSGTVRGIVMTPGTRTTVQAMQGAEVMGSTRASATGLFEIGLLVPGTFDLAFHPESGFADTTITGVTVAAGQTVSLGTLTLTPVVLAAP